MEAYAGSKPGFMLVTIKSCSEQRTSTLHNTTVRWNESHIYVPCQQRKHSKMIFFEDYCNEILEEGMNFEPL
jgi:hypothetical protein